VWSTSFHCTNSNWGPKVNPHFVPSNQTTTKQFYSPTQYTSWCYSCNIITNRKHCKLTVNTLSYHQMLQYSQQKATSVLPPTEKDGEYRPHARYSLYFTMARRCLPTIAPPLGGSGPAANTWFVGPMSPYLELHLDHFGHFCMAHSWTNGHTESHTDARTHTDHETSVTTGCILCTAKWCDVLIM